MVTVTPELADRIADVARLLLSDDEAGMPLEQLTKLAVELQQLVAKVVSRRDVDLGGHREHGHIAGSRDGIGFQPHGEHAHAVPLSRG